MRSSTTWLRRKSLTTVIHGAKLFALLIFWHNGAKKLANDWHRRWSTGASRCGNVMHLSSALSR